MLLVTAAVIIRDKRVLICQRSWEGAHPGKWEFPGGKVEPGETLTACVRRELQEELGIAAEPAEPVWRIQHRYPNGPACDIVFIPISRFTGEPANRCFAAMHWVALGDLARYDFLEADREFVRLLDDGAIALASSQA